MLLFKKKPEKIIVKFTRQSLNMGDDCLAPHLEEIEVSVTDRISDLLLKAKDYLPSMRNYEWEAKCSKGILGRLKSGESAEYELILETEDIKVKKHHKRAQNCIL
ncbi:MAG: hypothetical protein MJ171_03195, partial [Clostridia bacterium]|nr:hypothetical protein [Clostridia bacterium]